MIKQTEPDFIKPRVTQDEINDLYQRTYDHLYAKSLEAEKLGKSMFVLVGEHHLSPPNLLSNLIVISVARELGIKLSVFEEEAEYFSQSWGPYIKSIVSCFDDGIAGFEGYMSDPSKLEGNNLVRKLTEEMQDRDSFINTALFSAFLGMDLIGVEGADRTVAGFKDLGAWANFTPREEVMIQNLEELKVPAVGIFGSMHLQRIASRDFADLMMVPVHAMDRSTYRKVVNDLAEQRLHFHKRFRATQFSPTSDDERQSFATSSEIADILLSRLDWAEKNAFLVRFYGAVSDLQLTKKGELKDNVLLVSDILEMMKMVVEANKVFKSRTSRSPDFKGRIDSDRGQKDSEDKGRCR